MKNHFTLIADEKTVEAHGDMKKAFGYWKDRYAYAAYICVFGNGYRLDKKATLVSFNDNVNKGELYATYKAEISLSEFPHRIMSVGFAPYPGAEPCNECDVDVYPSSVTICGTVCLESKVGDLAFYPAENPLVRSLLGMSAFTDGFVRGGLIKSDSSSFLTPLPQKEISSSVFMDEEGLNIGFDAQDCYDYTFFADDKPCARISLGYFVSPEVQKEALCNGGFYADVISVSQATVDGATNFFSRKCITGLYEMGDSESGDFSGYELFSDPTDSYVGLKNGKEFYLFDGRKFNRAGSYVGELMLCCDGEIVSVCDGTIRFFNADKSVDVAKGETVVLYREGGYDIFVHSGPDLYIYRYGSELSSPLTIGVEENARLFRANDYSVIMAGADKKMYGSDGNTVNYFDDGTALSNGETYLDGCYYLDGHAGNFLNFSRVECEVAHGRFCLSGGKLCFMGENGVTELNVDGFEFSSAAVCGFRALFLSKGKLKIFAVEWSGVYVSLPHSGVTTYTAREWTKPSGYAKLKIAASKQ